jgi:hypothetical protein
VKIRGKLEEKQLDKITVLTWGLVWSWLFN